MATYYVHGGVGSDGAAGNSGAPWATLGKAYQAAAAGDTIKVRTATYYESLSISKANLVFEADTGHTPTIDGRYSPALFGAAGYTNFNGGQIKANELPAPTAANQNRGNWVIATNQGDIVSLKAAGATVRGFRIRNVCGGGVGLTANNTLLEDCWVDFTYAGAVGITGGCDRARVSNCIITRGSVKYFDPTRTSVAGPAGVQTCMNIRRSTNAIVEYCTVCFNFAEGINCGNDSVTPTARYNISHTNLHWNMGMNGSKGAKIYGNIVYWCENLAGAMDKDGPGPIFTAGDENAGGGSSSDQQIYNNLFVGGHTTFILASGSSNRPITLVRGYIGYNTLVGGAPTGRVMEFGVDPSDKHRNTVMENNIILKHPSMTDFVKLESGLNADSIVFRNNLSNQALPGVMAGTASIVTSLNGHGLVDPFVAITGTFDVKSTSLPTVTTSFDASNYDLASTAQGIGRASNRSNVNGLTLPVVAVDRYEDGRTDYNAGAGRYYDIGSDEYGGTTPPPDDDAVIASFNRTPGSGNAPLTVNFTDTSQALGAAVIDSWLWEFGDGDTSASQNPTHVYAAAGTYQVTLTVEDISEGLEDSFTGGTVTVTAVSGGSLSASFTRTPIGGEAPETITFTDTSTETGDAVINSWEWDFRDGSTSALQNPTHEYTVAGTYRPRLTVRDTVRGYQSIFTGPETVITAGAPDDAVEASFTQSATAGQAPLTVNFTDTSQDLGSATINSWRWDFGDGTIGTTQSPNHAYAAPGVYAPILTVRDTVLGLVDTAIGDLITVTAAPPPGAGGDVVIRQVRTALSTSDGNQTFTQAGLGGLRPKRARFVVTAATADGTAADGALFGIGATAGGSQWAASVAAEHGVANTNAARRWTDEACILLIDGSGNEVMRATFVDWATNGVTINIDWTGTPAAYLCTVEFGAGTEYEAWVGTAAVGALGSSTAVTAGFAADAVRGAATWGAKDTAETDATISLGMAHRLGGQYTLDRYYTDGAADGYNRMRLFENQLLHHRYNPSGRAGVSVGGWSATGFALTVISENINSTALLLAEKFGSVMSRVALVASRTSAGSESYGLDFDPQFVEHLISQATALGSYNDSATAGTIGVHTVTDDGELSNEISGENGSATTNEQSLSDNQLIVVGHTGTTLAAGATTLGTLQYSINHATAPGTAQRWPSLAVEAGQATGGGGDYLTAAYTADVVAGVAPLVVQFTDLSDGTNAITSWAWDFGDGYISTEQNPAHTYLSGGAWAVTLTVSDGTLTDSITTADFVVTTEVVKRRIIVGPYLMRVLRSDSTPVTHRDPVDEENAGYMEAGLALNHLPVSADGAEPDAGSDTVGFWYDAASDSWKTKRVDGTTGETGIT